MQNPKRVLTKEDFFRYKDLLPEVTIDREKLLCFFEELLIWNESINLISRASIENIFFIHLLDCLWISYHVASVVSTYRPLSKVIDVGSGGGLPGIVFKILYPHVEVSLIEKQEKKRTFLNHCIHVLSLTDIRVLPGIEGLGKHATYDCVLNRAFLNETEFFSFFSRRLVSKTILIRCIGGKSSSISPYQARWTNMRLIEERIYNLSERFGLRKIVFYSFVPRETNE